MHDQFFRQNLNYDKITVLFPVSFTSSYDLRLPRKFDNYICKAERFKHSFLPQMLFEENSRF